MRITWLVEVADQIWGGVKVALEDANWLHDRGHHVTVLSRSGPPAWMPLRCAFRRVADFSPANIPDSDVVIGTFWTTVPFALQSGKGAPVHYCQGYEGDGQENAPHRHLIEQVYRLPGVAHVTISPHLTRTLRERFVIAAREIVYAIDHEVMFPAPALPPVAPRRRVRVGLVGPYQIAWKDLTTGWRACELAARAGLDLQLVRVTNTEPAPDELRSALDVEWHRRVPPARMGEIYRSLDVYLATSMGGQEGFFLPAVEAMACGVPCVLTDIPCFRGHGDLPYALFVPPQDPIAMAEALVMAAKVPDVRINLRRHGIAAAQRYHRDAHGLALEQCLAVIAAELQPQTV